MTMNGPLPPGTWCCVTAVNRESSSALYFTFVLCFSEEGAKNAFISPSACVFLTVSYIFCLAHCKRLGGAQEPCVWEPAPQSPLFPQLPFHVPPRTPSWS